MTSLDPIGTLRRFVSTAPARPVERCDLCGAAIGHSHRHLFDPAARRLVCVCTGCALLFPSGGQAKYLSVPRRFAKLHEFQISDDQWNALGVPIGLAFFSISSESGSILAMYPSPAGITQSELPLDSWPELRSLAPDVETLLVNRTQSKRDYYVASIDCCYELAGLVRKHWRGLSGGSDVWKAIDGFLEISASVEHA